jgi:peptidoglycan/xylan/chitin deacetylase (PgdA/CDA1 family)
MLKIPITVCHGTTSKWAEYPLTPEHLSEIGFESIKYDQLEALTDGAEPGTGDIPKQPIMFDFDHADKTMLTEVQPLLADYGYSGTLFFHTGVMDDPRLASKVMTWDEIAQLMELGWGIGGHTVSHPNLSRLSYTDPDGDLIEQELRTADAEIERKLGEKPKDFAYTGATWSSIAEQKVKLRYRFGRLWIPDNFCLADGRRTVVAELMGIGRGEADKDQEADGGPVQAARYITVDKSILQNNRYRLPAMEICSGLMNELDQYRNYLHGALRL